MLILKLVSSLLLIILPAIVVLRDWKYHDRRTLLHHRITRVILIGWFVASIVTLVLLWNETREVKEMYTKVTTIDTEAKKHIKEARKAEESARVESSALSEQLKEMSTKIEPFVRWATAAYPEYRIDIALAKLVSKVETMEVKQEKLKQELVKKTSTPSMSVLSASATGDHAATIVFTPSNNQQLGRIELQAKVDAGNDSQILSFTPVGTNLMVSEQTSPDRKSANLGFSMLGSTKPVVMIRLSKGATVLVSGNNGLETFGVEIK